MEDVINKYYDDIKNTYGKMFLPVIKKGGEKKMILYLAVSAIKDNDGNDKIDQNTKFVLNLFCIDAQGFLNNIDGVKFPEINTNDEDSVYSILYQSTSSIKVYMKDGYIALEFDRVFKKHTKKLEKESSEKYKHTVKYYSDSKYLSNLKLDYQNHGISRLGVKQEKIEYRHKPLVFHFTPAFDDGSNKLISLSSYFNTLQSYQICCVFKTIIYGFTGEYKETEMDVSELDVSELDVSKLDVSELGEIFNRYFFDMQNDLQEVSSAATGQNKKSSSSQVSRMVLLNRRGGAGDTPNPNSVPESIASKSSAPKSSGTESSDPESSGTESSVPESSVDKSSVDKSSVDKSSVQSDKTESGVQSDKTESSGDQSSVPESSVSMYSSINENRVKEIIKNNGSNRIYFDFHSVMVDLYFYWLEYANIKLMGLLDDTFKKKYTGLKLFVAVAIVGLAATGIGLGAELVAGSFLVSGTVIYDSVVASLTDVATTGFAVTVENGVGMGGGTVNTSYTNKIKQMIKIHLKRIKGRKSMKRKKKRTIKRTIKRTKRKNKLLKTKRKIKRSKIKSRKKRRIKTKRR